MKSAMLDWLRRKWAWNGNVLRRSDDSVTKQALHCTL